MKKNLYRSSTIPFTSEEKSEKLLLEKMGVTKSEFQEIYLQYGVDASRLLELMQLSKYLFVYTGKVEGRCEPCMMLNFLKIANY